MTGGSVTVQQLLTTAGNIARKSALARSIPPRIDTACDPLSLTILKKVAEKGEATGAEIAGAVLLNKDLQSSADVAYAMACHLASPLLCRYPLLNSPDVFLPEKPPSMWKAVFTLSDAGMMVLEGLLPHCLINGYASKESRMPPIRAKVLAEAIQIAGEGGEDLDAKLSEIDFACPCLVEEKSGSVWASTGKGVVNCLASAEISGREVHVNMIPYGIAQEDGVEKLCDLLEDVPGVERCEARAEAMPVPWYKLVVICKNEGAAKSCLEAVLAGMPLRTKFKIIYTVSDGESNRTHSSPQEILRCYISNLVSKGGDASLCSQKLISLDNGSRSVKRTRQEEVGGVQAFWVIDSSGRNKVIPLSTIKIQSRGGKGGKISPTDLKVMIIARARQRCVIFGNNGMLSVLNIRAVDTSEGFLHPAETLPDGLNGVSSGVAVGGDKFILIATNQGLIKKVERDAMAGGRRGTKLGMKISGGDSLVSTCTGDEEQDVVLITSMGWAIRFPLKQLRSMGLPAKGVAGIDLKDGDRLASIVTLSEGDEGGVFLVASDGSGKVVDTSDIPQQNRGGGGNRIMEMAEGARIVGAEKWNQDVDVLLASRNGKVIRFAGNEMRAAKRDSANVVVMDIDEGDAIVFSGTTVSLSADEPDVPPVNGETQGDSVEGDSTQDAPL